MISPAVDTKEIFQIGRCPYCGDEVEIEPTGLCCGEVHGEYVYEDEDGNEYTEEQYREQLNVPIITASAFAGIVDAIVSNTKHGSQGGDK